MKNKLNPDPIKYIVIILLVISAILTIVSQFVVWGSIELDTKIGPADATLDAEFKEHSVNYVINVSGNLSLGIGGGLGGGLGGNINREIEDDKMFLTGLGDFQENIGLILDSYKEKRHTIRTSILDPDTQEFSETKILVETNTDLIPWWPEGMGQKYSVKITLTEPGNCKDIVIDNIKIILWRDFDSGKQVYIQSSEPLAEKSSNAVLSGRNESKTFNFDVKISQNYGRVGIIGIVDLIIHDRDGNEIPENTIINLGKSNPMPAAQTNNIYTMTTGDGISIVLMVLAFPISILSIVFMLIAIPFVLNRWRGCFGLVLFSTILGVLAVLFFISGIGTLISLLDSVLATPVRENFTWEIGMMIPGSMMVLLATTSFMTFMIRPPKRKGKKKGKGKGKDKKGKTKKGRKAKKAEEELPAFRSLGKGEVDDELYEYTEVELLEDEEPEQVQKTKFKKVQKGVKKGKGRTK